MKEIKSISMMDKNGEYLGEYVHYGDFCKMQFEYKAQIEKMKNCHNCKNWNWKHSKCDKRLKGDCFKNSKWESAE